MFALQEIAGKQAKYFFTFNGYANVIKDLSLSQISSKGHYSLSVGHLEGDAGTFVAVAVPHEASDCVSADDIRYRIFHTGFQEHKPAPDSIWLDGW